ncbi:MAG: amino acid permease [Vicinamibacterales bacterium]
MSDTTVAEHAARAVPSAGDKLVRAIGLRDAVLLVLGSVIGSGIFLTTGVMAETVPSMPLLLLAWGAGGALAIAGGLTYAELGGMFPQSGGLYVFLREAYGPLWAFLFGWAGLLIILTGSIATVAVGFAEYFSYFFPSLSMQVPVATLPMPWGPWTLFAGQVVAAASIAILAAINYVGVRLGNFVQALFTILKVGALAAIPVMAIAMHPVVPSLTPIVPDVPRLPAAFGVAMIAVMWTYEGWYYVAFPSDEIRDPARTVPRALVIGTILLTLIYMSVNVAYFYALPLSEIRGVVRIAEKAVTALMGPWGGASVALAVAVSTFGCNAAALLAVSRVFYAMAEDGRFFKAVGRIHPTYRTPHVAIVAAAVWSAFLTLTGSYEQLFTYVTFASVLFFAFGGVAVFRLRAKLPAHPRPYRTWGYPLTPGLFVLGVCVLVVNTLVERPGPSLIGLAIVAMGVPAFAYFGRVNRAAD